MKRFFKKLMAVISSVVAILSICAFSVAACETEDVESVLVDTTDSETEDVDFVLVDTMGSETDISPQSVQYGHLKGTHTEDGCSITFEVKVALRVGSLLMSVLWTAIPLDVLDKLLHFMFLLKQQRAMV